MDSRFRIASQDTSREWSDCMGENITTIKFLKDSEGTIIAKIKEDHKGRVIDVITYNDAQEQRWEIVETKTQYDVWGKK
jgi:hypothetical protein